MTARQWIGAALLMLAALLVVSMPLSVGLLDHDPRSRDEIGDYLAWIHEHETQYGLRMGLLIAKDAVFSVVAGVGLILAFSGVNRSLALAGGGGWLIATAGFIVIDGMEAAMIAFADDHALATVTIGSDLSATHAVARGIAIVSGLTGQVAFTSFAAGLIGFGVLFLRHQGEGVPAAWLGWLSLLAAAFWLLLWTSVLTDAGFAFIPLGGISAIVWMLGVGIYLVRDRHSVPEAAGSGPLATTT